jgi:NADPH:quinone reductase-like Zn-dependent oxidoreductase
LIHAVGSGVGIACVQLAAAVHATSFGTARTPSKLAAAQTFGLTHGFAPDELPHRLSEEKVDLVVDFVGGPYLATNLEVLAPCGRLVIVGVLGGAKAEIDLGVLLMKRLTVVGTMLRARPLEEKILATRAFEAEVVPLLASGTVKPVVDEVFDLADVRAAHELMASNETFGKIVLRLK